MSSIMKKGTEWDSILQINLPETAVRFLEKLAKKIKAEIERINAVDIADVGCGRGELVHNLAKELPSCNFTGYDLSNKMVNKLNKNASSNEKFQNLVLPDIPKRFFDCVLCINTLHYIQKSLLSIKQLWSIVRPGGLLIFNYPNRYYVALLPEEPQNEKWSIVEKPMRKRLNIISQTQIRRTIPHAKWNYLHRSGRHNIYLTLEKPINCHKE